MKPYQRALREAFEEMPTISQGHCCNLKMDNGRKRIWLCRDPSYGVTIEKLKRGVWVTIKDGHR